MGKEGSAGRPPVNRQRLRESKFPEATSNDALAIARIPSRTQFLDDNRETAYHRRTPGRSFALQF